MPESIAVHQLRGFMYDQGGQVLESLPGLIKVRLGGPGTAYQVGGGPLSWLGIGKKATQVEVELRMQHADPNRPLLAACLLHGKTAVKVSRYGLRGFTPDLSQPGIREPWRRL